MVKNRLYVALSDVPPELMDKPAIYSVTLVGIDPGNNFRHCGSGTLVKSGDQHFVLTAQHCAEPLCKYESIGFPIGLQGSPFIVQKLPPIYVGERTTDEWGPDLAFLPIHPVDVKHIHDNSNKTFFNLDRYEDEMLAGSAKTNRHLWAVVGSPISESNIEGPESYHFKRNTYSADIKSIARAGPFDYLEARASLAGEPLTPDFLKGLSGGGVWYANLGQREDGNYDLTEDPRLEGVAFYRTESDEAGTFVKLRCHGRRSVYQQGLTELRAELARRAM
ncbi:MAG: hypothetical protein AABO41_21625 [Acidobacteriota bacterium]